MKHPIRFVILAALALAWQGPGCSTPQPPTPVPPPAPGPVPVVLLDATAPPAPLGPPATPYEAACRHLEALGCKQRSDCAHVMQVATDSHLTLVPLACITTAPDVPSALACTFVRCQP